MTVDMGTFGGVEVPDCYAEVALAVAVHELAGDMLWGAIRRSRESPRGIVAKMIASADETIAIMPGADLPMSRARPQMDHPLFLRYVAAKIGAVRWLRRLENEYPGCLNDDAVDKHLQSVLGTEVWK